MNESITRKGAHRWCMCKVVEIHIRSKCKGNI